MNEIDKTNGLTIRNIRIAMGWTQLQLARAMLVSLRTVERWEQGTRRCPNGAVKMANLLKDKDAENRMRQR